ncbi:ArsR/SmtB family transcription factor [Streptomyces odontomachi]|uniref:ArsR/SmtB family transcription factor n=1 Tax=Streptomyces odontomachi TaxID=2944940 RepID=UPI00210BEFF4|nr:winged helix-turn-helix domain-containing protein [Streptomyces sp. ODS25]
MPAHRPSWLGPLAEGEAPAVTLLQETLRQYHQLVLAPYWERIRTLVDVERMTLARVMVTRGVDGLLGSLWPLLRWRRPVLEMDYPHERDVYLAGRGLLLVPSVFCWHSPVTFCDSGLRPVLVYPVGKEPGWQEEPGCDNALHGLRRLLGATRAAVLRAAEDGCTTTELARRAGVSPSTASQHATVLREARLLAATRSGNQMIHTLTPRGTALLQASQ